MNQQPVSAIIVGAGHRAFVYSKLALNAPDKLKIVGVADPDPIRRKKAMETFRKDPTTYSLDEVERELGLK